MVEALYVPVIKSGQDKDGNEYPVRIQPKIPKQRDPDDVTKALDDQPNVGLYIEGSEEKVELESFETLAQMVPKGSVVKAIIQPQTWYIAGKFGLSLKVLQILVKPRTTGRPSGYAFSVSVKTEVHQSDSEEDVDNVDSDVDEANEADETDEESRASSFANDKRYPKFLLYHFEFLLFYRRTV